MTSPGRQDQAGATYAPQSPRHPLRNMRQPQPPVRSDTQITQVGIERTRCRRAPQAAPNGGYRTMPAASDRHAARLAFQIVSALIAESAP